MSLSHYLKQALRKLNYDRTTEAYFVGYPKTGNTWTRFMLGHYIQQACGSPIQPLFDASDWLGRCEKYCVGPAIQFTHRPLEWQTQSAEDLSYENVVKPYSGKKIVLIVRHPLDVLVSHWHQETHQVRDGFKGDLCEFIQHPVFGIQKYFKFHQLWMDAAANEDKFFLLRYEDMKKDPEIVFARLLDFLGIEKHKKFIDSSIAHSSFENMQKLEVNGNVPKYESSGLKIFATGDSKNLNSFHVRKGKVGGYEDYLDVEAILTLTEMINQNLSSSLGYGK